MLGSLGAVLAMLFYLVDLTNVLTLDRRPCGADRRRGAGVMEEEQLARRGAVAVVQRGRLVHGVGLYYPLGGAHGAWLRGGASNRSGSRARRRKLDGKLQNVLKGESSHGVYLQVVTTM